MPKVRRWFHVSHDLNADPEVWELTDLLGDRALRLWLEVLSIADRNDGEIPGWIGERFAEPSPQLRRALAGRSRMTGETVRKAFRFFAEKSWTVPGTPHRVRNRLKYRMSWDDKKIPGGEFLQPPPTPTPTPTPTPNKEVATFFAFSSPNQNGNRPTQKNPLPARALHLASKLNISILTNYPGTIPPTEIQMKKWAVEFDRLNRIDNQPWEKIDWLLTWCQQDPFWKQNIHSGATFRRQWNKLLAKATAEQPYSPPVTEKDRLQAAVRAEQKRIHRERLDREQFEREQREFEQKRRDRL